jgi:TonB family protein
VRRRHVGLGFVFAFQAFGAIVSAQQQSPSTLTVAEVKDHPGEMAVVCGHPAGFVCSSAGTVFNFLAPDQSIVKVFVPKASRSQFGPRLEDRFAQRNVCATGRIDLLGTSYQIAVTHPDLLVLEPGQPPPATVFGPMAYRLDCDPGIVSPKLKKSIKPNYTPEAMSAGIAGKVQLRGVVEADGRVGDILVVRPLAGGLTEEAVKAAKRFEFVPGTLDGMPVAEVVSFEIEFTLRDR